MKVCECMCVYESLSCLSSFLLASLLSIHIHTHIHIKHTFASLKNSFCEGGESEVGSSLIIHIQTHTHTFLGDVHG